MRHTNHVRCVRAVEHVRSTLKQSQRQVAEAVGVTLLTVHRWQHPQPSGGEGRTPASTAVTRAVVKWLNKHTDKAPGRLVARCEYCDGPMYEVPDGRACRWCASVVATVQEAEVG